MSQEASKGLDNVEIEMEPRIVELEEIKDDGDEEIIVEMKKETQPPSRLMRWKAIFLNIFSKVWFFTTLGLTILLAYLIPDVGKTGGPLHPEITVKYCSIPFLFLCSGLKIPSNELLGSLLAWRFHVFAQVFVYGLFPLLMFGLSKALEPLLNPYLIQGLMVMSCFPTTTTTCVILTRSANGNESKGLFNAAFSNIIGIFICPALLYIYVSASGSIPFLSIIITLLLTVLLPIVVGQIIQLILSRMGRVSILAKIPTGHLSNLVLFFVVFTVFSDSFSQKESEIEITDWLYVGLALVGFHALVLTISFFLSGIPIFKFDRKDRVALIFISIQKTLGMGVPFINIVYEGNPNIGYVFLPIMIYHPLQLATGGLLVTVLKSWVMAQRNEKDVTTDTKGFLDSPSTSQEDPRTTLSIGNK
eukprot:TRINITY_DN9671_c0_g1_i1.p1 TRINITY_DN9671_c0_g1~~TRINITY_DN9671_c0_g1_i1.p1  ORF type:complete len:417 (-),score=93.76 TRINITY_DN9671_c0_g1_i1:19-1269(-)